MWHSDRMWQGQERRSSASVAARALVKAREQAAEIEAERSRLSAKRFKNRKRMHALERDLREIRAVERRCLEALGAASDAQAPSEAQAS